MEINQKIGLNIRKLRNAKGLTQEQLADFINVSSGAYSHYENGIRAIPIEELIKLSIFFHIALDALVKYDLNKVDLSGLVNIGENRLLFPILLKDSGKQESVEIVPFKVTAGYLTGYSDPEFIESLTTLSLPFLKEGKHRAFQIRGDSMLPIETNAYIIGKYVDSFDEIEDGKTYIVVTKHEGATYKRVYNLINEEGKLLIKPYNGYFKDYTIDAEDVIELWRFKYFISEKEYDNDELNFGKHFPQISSMQNDIKTLNKDIKEIKKIVLKQSNE
jgi:transcriptional regulator with XRE-family HTH domain